MSSNQVVVDPSWDLCQTPLKKKQTAICPSRPGQLTVATWTRKPPTLDIFHVHQKSYLPRYRRWGSEAATHTTNINTQHTHTQQAQGVLILFFGGGEAKAVVVNHWSSLTEKNRYCLLRIWRLGIAAFKPVGFRIEFVTKTCTTGRWISKDFYCFLNWATKKTKLTTFPYTGWLIGLLVMVYILPIYLGSIIPYITQPTRGFFIAQFAETQFAQGQMARCPPVLLLPKRGRKRHNVIGC